MVNHILIAMVKSARVGPPGRWNVSVMCQCHLVLLVLHDGLILIHASPSASEVCSTVNFRKIMIVVYSRSLLNSKTLQLKNSKIRRLKEIKVLIRESLEFMQTMKLYRYKKT